MMCWGRSYYNHNKEPQSRILIIEAPRLIYLNRLGPELHEHVVMLRVQGGLQQPGASVQGLGFWGFWI